MTALRQTLLAGTALALAGCAGLKVNTDFDRDASFEAFRSYAWVELSDDERSEMEGVSPFLERRLTRAVDTVLGARGFTQRTDGDADFLVDTYVVSAFGGSDSSSAAQYGYGLSRMSLAIGLGYGSTGYGYSRSGLGYGSFGYPYLGLSSFGFGYFGTPYLGLSSFAFPYVGFPLGYGGVAPWRATAGALDGYLPGTLVVDIFDAESGDLIWRGWADRAMLYAPEGGDQAEFMQETIEKILRGFPPRA